MCGIGGIVRMSERPIEASQVKTLLLGLESRGRDAAGVVLVNSPEHQILIHKSQGSASRFVDSTEYRDFMAQNLSAKTKIVLVHTRAFTTGNPSVNANNHPLTKGLSAVVHNGIIYNHKKLFDEMHLDRAAETDSDIIRAIVDSKGISKKTIKALCKLDGSCAAAIVHPEKPGSVLLLRSGNPLEMFATVKDPDHFHHVVWASKKDAARMATWRWRRVAGAWGTVKDSEVMAIPFAADTAQLIGPKGFEWHQEFKTAPYTRDPWQGHSGSYYDDWEGCGSRSYAPPRALPGPSEDSYIRRISCPSCQYRSLLLPKHYNTPKADLTCAQCKKTLENAVEIWSLKRRTDA